MSNDASSSDPLQHSIKKLESFVKETRDQVDDTLSTLLLAEESEDLDSFFRAHQKPENKKNSHEFG